MTKIPKVTLFSFACLGSMLVLASCSSSNVDNSGTGGSGQGGSNATGGSNGTGGSSSTGGTVGATGGTTASGGSQGTGGGTASGGVTGTGGSASGGRGGSNATGGNNGSGGSNATGGGNGTGGNGAAGAPGTDMGGMPLATCGTSTKASKSYLNLGDMRLLNNRWGSDALNCSGTTQSVFANCDNTMGWTFSRPACGGSRGDPDFPEMEFGVAPFGAGSSLLTSPAFSSTTVLPIQIKNLTSASVNLTNLHSTFTNPSYYDTNFEFWISKENPLTSSNPQVYAEIIMFVDWEANRNNSSAGGWTCDKSGTVSANGLTFNLCHQSDSWGSGSKWRFFNFNLSNGPQSNFTGKGDVKALLDWVMKTYSGFSTDMWLTRIEVGTEVDDSTVGQTTIGGITFEVNGTTKSPQVAK